MYYFILAEFLWRFCGCRSSLYVNISVRSYVLHSYFHCYLAFIIECINHVLAGSRFNAYSGDFYILLFVEIFTMIGLSEMESVLLT